MSFGFGALIFHRLILNYTNGESNLIKESKDDVFSYRVPPFCLGFCYTPGPVTKRKLLFVRILITQFPIVHGIMYIFYNIKSIEYPTANNVFFIPFMLASILPVVWGLNILFRLAVPIVPEHLIPHKYFCLQLVLLMCKIQPAIGDLIISNAYSLYTMDVPFPMSVEVYKNGRSFISFK